MRFDTIVAPITGTAKAAVAIVRVSGPDAWTIAAEVFHPWNPESHKASYGHFANGDDGLALPFAENQSYTGEQSVELSCHGSPASVRSLVEACIRAGARMAEPGEFTQRAFMNGRIDLTQAEAVRDTIEAQTDAQLRFANLNREGALHREVGAISDECIGLLAAVEASVDFAEEIGEFDREAGREKVDNLLRRIAELLNTAEAGRIMRQGLRIAIVGPPNAGKSSLMNALLGTDRSIVTDVPGTTRDFVEEQADIGGVPCVLIDTAGLRDTDDPVESIGVQRTRAQAANADLIWYVYDSSVGWTDADVAAATSFGRPVLVVANKADLIKVEPVGRLAVPPIPSCPPFPYAASVSARTGLGLDFLGADIHETIFDPWEFDSGPTINLRHQPLLERAQTALVGVAATLDGDQPDDLLSVGLQEAIGALGEITGETATPDIIDRIFHDFCIGK